MLASLANDVEAWTNSVAHVAQVAAIAVGAVWAYNRFVRQREKWPKAALDQRIEHRRLDGSGTLLRIWLKVSNVSQVRLTAEVVRTDVYRVLPMDESVRQSIADDKLIPERGVEADWPCIGTRQREDAGEIEPGEWDEFGFDFIVPGDTTTVFVYSYLRNPTKKKRELGWSISTLHELGSARGEQRQRAGQTRRP